MVELKVRENRVSFKVRVQPRAAKNQLAGIYEDAIKVRLTAPPVDGEANAACCEFFAKLFKVPKSQVHIEQGQTGRNKVIAVEGRTVSEVRSLLGLEE